MSDTQNLNEQGVEQAAAAAADTLNGNATTDAGADAAADAAESALAAVIAQLQAELDAERARTGELMDKFQRTAAEFQNARKRQERQMDEAIERASMHVVKKLLPVVDDLDLAFRNVLGELDSESAAWIGGFRQIQKKLQAILEEEQVTQMPANGPFDPVRHEAVTNEPNDSVESGHIIATLRVGYEHKGRVLRPALVRVAA